MVDSLEQLGQLLKEKREKTKKSVSEMAKLLKVNVSLLEDLENGQKVDTDNAYARLLLKRYMSKINLDYSEYEKDIKELYPSVVEETITFNQDEIDMHLNFKNKRNTKKIFGRILVVIFIVLVVLLTAYNIKENIVEQDVQEILNPTTLISNTTLEPENIIEKEKPKYEVAFDNAIASVKLDDLKDVKVKIDASGACYFDYKEKNTGIIKSSKTLQKDDKMEFTLDDASKYDITIGAISKVKILINEEDISEYFKDKKGKINIEFKNL